MKINRKLAISAITLLTTVSMTVPSIAAPLMDGGSNLDSVISTESSENNTIEDTSIGTNDPDSETESSRRRVLHLRQSQSKLLRLRLK